MGWGWGSSTPSGDEWPPPPAGFTVDPGFGGACAPGSVAGQAPSSGCPCGTTPVKKWYTAEGFCCRYTACVSNTTAKTTKNNPCRIIA